MTLALAAIAVLLFGHLWLLLGTRRLALRLAAAGAGFSSLVSVRLTGALTVGDALLVGAILLGLLGTASRPPGTPNPHLRMVGLAAVVMFVGGALATVLESTQPPDSSGNLLAYTLSATTAIALVVVLRPTLPEIRLILGGYAAGVLVSLYVARGQDSTIYRPTGLATTANHLGLTCMFGFAACVALFVTAERTRARWLYAAAAAACLYGVNLSGSRAALAGALVAITITIIMQANRRLSVLVGIGTGAVAFAVLTGRIDATATSGISRLLGQGAGATTAVLADRQRAVAYNKTTARIDEHPVFGSGWGDALLGHDLYLQMYAIGGIFGAISAGLLILVTIRALLRAKADCNSMALVLWAGYAGYLVAGIRSNQMWDRYIWVALVLAAAASLAGRRLDGGTESVLPHGAIGVDRQAKRLVVEPRALPYRTR